MFSIASQWPLVNEHGLMPSWLYTFEVECCLTTICHALLFLLYIFLRIWPSPCSSQFTSLLYPSNNVNKNIELNMSLIYCVVQFSFHIHDLMWFLFFTLELKGILRFMCAIMKVALINHISNHQLLLFVQLFGILRWVQWGAN